MSATRLWSMHLEAARSLIDLMGGFESLWNDGLKIQGLFTLYIMIDVMSPPTSPSWSINESQQRGYLVSTGRMEAYERRTIASFQPCPLQVLQAIIQTSVLRAAITRAGNNGLQSHVDSDAGSKLTQTMALTLASLLRFDPSIWSNMVCTDYLELPKPRSSDDANEAAWTGLATAYQSAAIVYLLRSTQQTALAQAAGSTDTVEAMLAEQRNRLSSALSYLCRDLSRAKASSLWRFVSWPLFICAYELVAWTPIPLPGGNGLSPNGDSPDTHDLLQPYSTTSTPAPKHITAMIRRLQKVARRLGANSMFDAVELLEGVWRRRVAQAYTGDDSRWKWDDGFEGRCVFVV